MEASRFKRWYLEAGKGYSSSLLPFALIIVCFAVTLASCNCIYNFEDKIVLHGKDWRKVVLFKGKIIWRVKKEILKDHYFACAPPSSLHHFCLPFSLFSLTRLLLPLPLRHFPLPPKPKSKLCSCSKAYRKIQNFEVSVQSVL